MADFIKGIGSAAQGFAVGSSEVKAMYLGETKIYELPYDAEIEYLQATGTQWIDYHDYMAYDDDFEFDFKIDSLTSSGSYTGGYVMGSNANSTRAYALGWYKNGTYGNKFLLCFADDTSSYTTFPTPQANLRYTIRCHVQSGNMQMTVNGTTYTDTVAKSANQDILALFARASSQSNGGVTAVNTMSYITLYSLKHYRGGTLIRDMIPVRVGQVGYMYDKVGRQLYGNKGSGSFTIGPDL